MLTSPYTCTPFPAYKRFQIPLDAKSPAAPPYIACKLIYRKLVYRIRRGSAYISWSSLIPLADIHLKNMEKGKNKRVDPSDSVALFQSCRHMHRSLHLHKAFEDANLAKLGAETYHEPSNGFDDR